MKHSLDILLKCDISGIQSFIFNVPSKGAAKELKSRSMYIQEISKKCNKELVAFFEGDEVEELYNGGGNFYLKISTNKTEDNIRVKIKEMQSEYLTGDVFPYFAFVEKKSDISASLNNVNRSIQRSKLQRTVSFDLLDATPVNAPKVNINDIKGINGQVPNGDFTWIADQSIGDKKLAALKLDVDNLGSLFLGRTENEFRKMSEEFTTFFDRKLLELIIKENMQQNIYVVFSGGDDCFLIGSWNNIFDLSIILRKKFFDFQDALRKKIKFDVDKEITFSAGITVFTSHYPMLQMSEEVEDALNASKLNKYGENDEKNSVTVFGKTVTWKEFEEAQTLAYTLTDLIKNQEESKNLNMIFRLVVPIDNELPKVWRLKYFLRRNVKKKNEEIVKNIFNDYEQALLFKYLKINKKNPDVFLIASRWSELSLKNSEQNI